MLQIDARGLVAQANAEIRAAEAAHQSRKAERQRLRRPIALIDGLINDLELLNLRGGTRVPLAYEPRLLQLRAMLADNVSAEQLDNLRGPSAAPEIDGWAVHRPGGALRSDASECPTRAARVRPRWSVPGGVAPATSSAFSPFPRSQCPTWGSATCSSNSRAVCGGAPPKVGWPAQAS